ncbi:MAG: hypothetical protein WBD95_09645 [Xanthobacteraceae bacterium]
MSASFQFSPDSGLNVRLAAPRFFVGVGGGRRLIAVSAHQTAGLRREEVAQRANVSTIWYIIRDIFAVFPLRRLIR